MFYGDTVQDTRKMFFVSWDKYQNKLPLSPLENQITQVILDHPEYHQIFANKQWAEKTYYPELGESNPFLHMGLHLAIREQTATDRPQGISKIYKNLVKKYADRLAVEHLIMEQLAESLWLAQKNQMPPDEKLYLERLHAL